MELTRSSGILLHITSLPGAFGIGDIGPEAYNFIDFLAASGHKYWQLLPLNPTDGVYSHSPYSSHSAFAGNPWIISPELLAKDGFIELEAFPPPPEIQPGKVIFDTVVNYKIRMFDAAFRNFLSRRLFEEEFMQFCREHEPWLENYALYMALREKYEKANWVDWPKELRDREPDAMKAAEAELSEKIQKEKFIQFLFFSQWKRLVIRAHKNSILLFGDIPFYVNHDSADCWAKPEFFKLDEHKNPTHVSGVPPDLFSKTGQLWGTPVYDWKNLQLHNFDWWISRLRQNLVLFDVIRLDHFRAFSAYWEVPAGEETAIKGSWKKTPGSDFFSTLKKEFPRMPFIAEDLGSLDQPVFDLLEEFHFPGMKVLQFAFGDPNRQNPYLPYNHVSNSVVYTGTHDNNTTRGWFEESGTREKEHLENYTGMTVTTDNVAAILHRLALQSVAALAVTPLQDIANLGKEAIMNVPGSTRGNWSWRIKKEDLPVKRTEELKQLNDLFGRL